MTFFPKMFFYYINRPLLHKQTTADPFPGCGRSLHDDSSGVNDRLYLSALQYGDGFPMHRHSTCTAGLATDDLAGADFNFHDTARRYRN